jgi:CO/xanthine dehydrogenase Mo-binding subunit
MAATIGRSVPRKEGRSKVTGSARYVDDVTLPGMIFGATVRSTVPRGIIRGIRYEPGVPWDEFTVVTAADIPGSNRVALIVDDQPYLASDRINHPEEPIVLLAHPDPQMLELARRRVVIDVEPLPGVFGIDDALAGRAIVWGEDNLFKSYLVSRGDVDAAFRDAQTIVDG